MSETEGTYMLPPVVFDWMQDAAVFLLGVDGDEAEGLLSRLKAMQYATIRGSAPTLGAAGAPRLAALQGGAPGPGPDTAEAK